ncbi:MAG: ribosomal protein S18-alanine N-acetyltransferase [Pseudomonadales bacterium]
MAADPSLGAITFRAMRHVDLDTVVKIEAASYEFPWSRGTFEDCMRASYECWIGTLSGNEQPDEIVGHGILNVSVDEAHLLNVCVKTQSQGCGFGREIVLYLVDRAKAKRAKTMFLEVRPSNGVARELYDSVGFCQVGIRKGYYPVPHGREDGIVLALSLEVE